MIIIFHYFDNADKERCIFLGRSVNHLRYFYFCFVFLMYNGRRSLSFRHTVVLPHCHFADSLPEASIYYRYMRFTGHAHTYFCWIGSFCAELELINCNFASRMRKLRMIKSSTRGLKAMILGRREEDQERQKWANWTARPSPQMAKTTAKLMGYIYITSSAIVDF